MVSNARVFIFDLLFGLHLLLCMGCSLRATAFVTLHVVSGFCIISGSACIAGCFSILGYGLQGGTACWWLLLLISIVGLAKVTVALCVIRERQ